MSKTSNPLVLVFIYLRAFIKMALFFTVITFYFITCIPFLFFIEKFPIKTRKILTKIVSFYCFLATKVLCINVSVTGNKNYLKSTDNYFYIANHMTYLDIFICSSFLNSCYVTSIEIKKTPALGQVTQAAGCLYTERRSRDNLSKEIKGVTDGLKSGLNVFVFPEATSTNGDEVIMFRKSMFQAPVDAQKEILPMTINYRKVSGETFSLQNRDNVCWYDDMTFPPSFKRVLLQSSIDVEVYVHEPVMPKVNQDTIELANQCHSIVSSKYTKLRSSDT